ncbi:MAG: Gfo/Idh/MocA family protein [Thermomicrobiales bacterium]
MNATYRVGIVGCSGIAIARPERSAAALRSLLPHSHAAAYHAVPATEVVAVCDIMPEATARFGATWGPAATYTDYRAMIERERLDLISIVTPDHLHAEVLLAACAAGIRGIFCEKPIATTLADADRMIAAAERSGAKVLVNHTRRFDPFYRQAKWLLDEGAIGALRRILGTMGGPRAMLFRNGTHLLDTIAYFADAAPLWVSAELDDEDRGYGTAYRGDGGHDPATEPGASAYFHFANGVRAFYNGSKQIVANFELDLHGERGRLRLGNQVAELATLVGDGLATQPLPLHAPVQAGMVTAVEELLALMDTDGDGVAALRAARVTLEMLLGLLASAAAGSEKVSFPLAAVLEEAGPG